MSPRSHLRVRIGLILLVGIAAAAAPARAQNLPLATFLDIDVPAVSVSGDFTVDGGRMPDSTGEFAFLVLEDEYGLATPMGASFLHGYGPAWLIPGLYQRRYDFVQSSTGALPQSTRANLGPTMDVDADATIDFDVPTLEVEFSFLLGGQPFPNQAGEVAWLSLRDRDNGETTLLSAGHLSPTTVRIVPGRYDVVYQYGSGDLLPRNENAIVSRTLDLVADGRVTVDVPSVFAIFDPSLNGAAFPASAYERGRLRLVDFETGDVAELGDTNAGSLPVPVIPGIYDVTYERMNGGSLVPMNAHAVVAEAISIEAPATPNQLLVLPIEVTAHPVERALTLDGAAFPASAYERGEIVLVGVHGDEADLGDTSDASPDPRFVVEGTYDVHYRRVAGGSIVPRNADARIATSVRIDEATTLSVDVPTVEIDLSAHLDGVPFPASAYERGDIHLEGPTPGDRFRVGGTDQLAWTVRLIPGAYDAFYDFIAGGGIVPRNPMQRVETDLAFLTSRAETLEIWTRAVIPSFSMNEAPFPIGGFDRGEIVLRGPGGSALSLGETNVASPPSLRVIEAPYGVDYRWVDGDTVPLNVERRVGYAYVPEPGFGGLLAVGALALARVRRRANERATRPAPCGSNSRDGLGGRRALSPAAGLALAILAAGPVAAQPVGLAHFLEVDVPSVPVQGDLRIDGVPAPASAGDVALVALEDVDGDRITVGSTNDQTYGPLRVVPGTYDAIFDFLFTTGPLPVNTGTPFATELLADGGRALDLDVPTVEISLDFLLDGMPFPVAPSELAHFLLRHVPSGAEFPIGTNTQLPFTFRVIPGEYDVIYAYQSGGLLPHNTHAIVEAAARFERDGARVFDLTRVFHGVDATLDGAPFPMSAAERGEIRLVDFASGDSVSFGPTNAPAGILPILAGVYDATYTRMNGGGFVPANSNAVVAEGIVVTPPTLPGQLSISAVDVVSHVVTRDVTIDGAPAVASMVERGDVVFVGEHGDEIDFGSTHQPSPSRRVVAGRYDVFYRGQQGWTAVPGNPNARIASGIRIDEDETVAIDIPTVQLSFDLRVDGAPSPPSQLERGRFRLVGPEPGDVIDLRATHETTPSPRVVAGPYDLVYDWEAGSVLVPRNLGFHALEGAPFLTDQTVSVDLTTRAVIPTFRLNGSSFPTDPAERGEIWLRDARGGEVSLGTTDEAEPATLLVVEAPYAVEYRWDAGVEVPRNPRATVGLTSVPEPTPALGLTFGAMLCFALGGRGPAALRGRGSAIGERIAEPARGSLPARA